MDYFQGSRPNEAIILFIKERSGLYINAYIGLNEGI
jgi:hypothetical protein